MRMTRQRDDGILVMFFAMTLLACGAEQEDTTSAGTAAVGADGVVADAGAALDGASSGGASSGGASSGGASSGASSSGASSDGGSSDASAAQDAAEDPCKFPDSPAPGEPGSSCSDNSQCDSNWCVGGVEGKQCTKTCVECCPSGWKCDQAPGSDTTFICIPKLAALCLPCKTDAECEARSKGALCIMAAAESELEGTSFCGGECAVAADCPSGYTCKDVQGEKGASKQCVRDKNMCSCTETAVKSGVEAVCTVTNPNGTCSGTRKCAAAGLTKCSAPVPAVETCNGKDDDCDGQTDENVAAQPCETKNQYGACKGTTACKDGALLCEAAQPEAEKCDGEDNDCDGVTDEGCDDDGDGFCAKGIAIEGLPKVCEESVEKCNASGALPKWCPKGIGDCNDEKGKGDKINPAAKEACGDFVDNDCDGGTDVPSDEKDEPLKCTKFYKDGDKDGIGAGEGRCLCAPTAEYNSALNTDCNDKDQAIAPGVKEICGNKIDDNCNNDQNENGAKNCKNFWVDEDGDGFGGGDSKCFCAPKGKYKATAGGDCDDSKKLINPKVKESCNKIDDNCDGATDEADAAGCKLWYVDGDQDGYGDASKSKCLCAKEAPYTTLQGGDCADDKTTQHPGWKELCHDGIDNNCNGETDEEDAKLCVDIWQDLDGDGFGNPKVKKCLCDKDPKSGFTASNGKDCNDDPKTGKLINPDAKEICDGKDNDCVDGADTGCDADGDGFCTNAKTVVGKPASCPKGGGDCNDDPKKYGKVVYPGRKEICNGRDDNCKNGTDEGCDDDGDGYCDKAITTIGKPASCPKGGGDCNDKNKVIYPGRKESCNNIDDDCDSKVDEGCDDDKDGYCDKNMQVVGIPKVCKYGPGDCCDVDANARPKQGGWFASKNKCGSYDYNCSKELEKRWTIKAAPKHICVGFLCSSKAECIASPQGWKSSAPACGASGVWITDYTWNGSLALPLVNTCTKQTTTQRTQMCH